MKHSTGKPTRYEAERIAAILRLGCVACAQLGLPNVASDVHHIVEGNRRLGHWYTLPLCPGHHRKVWTLEQMEVIPVDIRVSIADGTKAFEAIYGTEREMWSKVQHRLKLPTVWPSSKIVPRSVRQECALRLGASHVEVAKTNVAVVANQAIAPTLPAGLSKADAGAGIGSATSAAPDRTDRSGNPGGPRC